MSPTPTRKDNSNQAPISSAVVGAPVDDTAQSLNGLDGVLLVGVGQDEGELVTSDASEDIGLTNR